MGNKMARRRPAIDERFTRPQGLYPHRDVDHRKLRKLILDSKLAPCYPGAEEPAADLEECPICFLHYPSLNRSKCCAKGICTECFLQMKSPHVSRPTQCPFCKTPNYAVEFRGAKTLEEKGVEQAEEQKVIEAKIRMRRRELQDEEDRVQQRENDVREGRPTPVSPQATVSNMQTFPVPLGRGEVDGSTVIDAVAVGGREPWIRGTIGRPVGTPQPGIFSSAGLFATPSVAVDPDSLWFRGGQRNEAMELGGGLRPPVLASNVLPSVRMPSSSPLGGNPAGSGSTGSAVGAVVGPLPGIRGGGSAYARFNRDDEFDLDLEDIMVMEAIWLSIQEQGPQRESENEPASLAPENISSFLSQMTPRQQDIRIGDSELAATSVQNTELRDAVARRNSVTGGLAGAIAALAERQVTGVSGDHGSTNQALQNESMMVHPEQTVAQEDADQEAEMGRAGMDPELYPDDVGTSSTRAIASDSDDWGAFGSCLSRTEQDLSREAAWPRGSQYRGTEDGASSEGLTECEGSSVRESAIAKYIRQDCPTMAEWMLDSSSQGATGGTSFSSSIALPSDIALATSEHDAEPGSSEHAGNASETVPDSFEEQVMLAMALSLAEAQSRDGRGGERGCSFEAIT